MVNPYNDIHKKMLLVMLPYDADKVAELDVDLLINGKSAKTLKLDPDTIKQHFKVGGTLSFLDVDKRRIYYKLIADSDEKVAAKDYSAGNDAAAFLEVDAKGSPILDAKTHKPNVIVTFPGLNDPLTDILDAGRDKLAATAYDESFFNTFMAKLTPALQQQGVSLYDVEVIAHSMGDKNAAEYASRFKPKAVMVIDGWDKKDSVIGAAVRNVLRDHQTEKLTKEGFEKAFAAEVEEIVASITEVNPSGKEAVIGRAAYEVIGAGHTGKHYVNLSSKKVAPVKGIAANMLSADYAHDNIGWLSPTTNLELCFKDSFENMLGTGVSGKDILELRTKLEKSGVQVDDMQQAAKVYFNPQATQSTHVMKR